MATPALRALRRAFPEAELVGACRPYVEAIARRVPHLDRLEVLQPSEERSPLGLIRLARRLRRLGPDAVVLLTNSFSTAVAPFLARVPVRAGHAGDGRTWMLNRRAHAARAGGRRAAVPMAAWYQSVLDTLDVPPAGPAYELVLRPEDRPEADAWLEAVGFRPGASLVAINPGARFGSSKLWLPERYAETAARLVREDGVQVVVLCGPGEQALVRQITSAAGEGVLDGARQSLSLGGLAAVLERVSLLITTDSGPRHMALAFGRPVVALMGPIDPAWTAWNLERSRVLLHPVDCSPCGLRTCPIGHDCMRGIAGGCGGLGYF